MSTGGFKWKEKSNHEEPVPREEKRLERGYRDMEKPHPRSPTRDDVRNKFGDDYDTRYSRKNDDVASKFGAITTTGDGDGEKPEKKKKEKKRTGPKPTDEAMIIVNVNNRLGTKNAIPCLPSDPISK